MYSIFITAKATVSIPKLPTNKRDEIVKRVNEIHYVRFTETDFAYDDADYIEFETDLDVLDCTYDECGVDEVTMDTEYIEDDICGIVMEVAGEDAMLDTMFEYDYSKDWVKEKIEEVQNEYWIGERIDRAYNDYMDEKLNGR